MKKGHKKCVNFKKIAGRELQKVTLAICICVEEAKRKGKRRKNVCYFFCGM